MQFRPGQGEAVDAVFEDMESGKPSRGILVLPTSAGKSFIIAGIAARYKEGPVIVLQPSKELLEQNYEKYELTGAHASVYSASFGKKDLGDVTFATLGSIVKAAKEINGFRNVLVLCDEAHYKYPPERGSQFRNFIDIVKPKYLYGLTATPFRMHNSLQGSTLKMLTRTRPLVFNKILFVQQISEIVSLGYWSPSIDERWVYDDSYLELNSSGSDYVESSIKRANEANSVNRNIAIKIHELLKEGKRKSILVFVDSVESADIFATYFKKYTKSEFIHGGTNKKDRTRIIKGFKSGEITILFNHSILTTGFDYPGLDVIFMGRPTNSLAMLYQIYGRGVRIKDGKSDFLFVDCCDTFGKLCHPRDIVIEDHPIAGWSVFAGDKLVTNVSLLGPPITKQDLHNTQTPSGSSLGTFPFGKYKGRDIEQVCSRDRGYVEYLSSVIDTQQYGPVFKNNLLEGLRRTALKAAISS